MKRIFFLFLILTVTFPYFSKPTFAAGGSARLHPDCEQGFCIGDLVIDEEENYGYIVEMDEEGEATLVDDFGNYFYAWVWDLCPAEYDLVGKLRRKKKPAFPERKHLLTVMPR